MQCRYWRNIHKRAVKDARHALRIETADRVVITVIVMIIAIAVIWLVNTHEMATNEIIKRVCYTVAVIIAFPAVYFWKFIAAPAKIDAEERNARVKAEAQATAK